MISIGDNEIILSASEKKPKAGNDEFALEGKVDVYHFSQDVLKELMQDNVPSIPSNYAVYFDKMLDKGPEEIKKKIGETLSYTDAVVAAPENSIYIEKEVRQSYIQIKSMLQAVGLIYKNLAVMKTLAQKHSAALESGADILAVQKVLREFRADLNKLTELMRKHIDIIKLNYEEIGRVFKAVEEQAIYDSRFDIYNKKYLLLTMAGEAESVKRYGYKSSFLLTKISDRVLGRIKNTKERESILALVAKILLKTSRRSDVVAHYGDGIFAMVMKHTDLDGARKACERIMSLLYASDYSSQNEVLKMEFLMLGTALKADFSVEESLSVALDRLLNTNPNEQPIIME